MDVLRVMYMNISDLKRVASLQKESSDVEAFGHALAL